MTKIDALTQKEIDEVFSRWYQGEKVNVLLEELNIEKIPNLAFPKYFPSLPCNINCPNCSENLFAFRSNSVCFKKTNKLIDISTAHCLNCKHVESINCSCERCSLIRKEERRIHSEKEAEKLKERAIHLERLYDQIVPIDFEKDGLTDLIYFYALCYQSTCEDVTLISPPSTAESPMTPSQEWDTEIIQSLLKYIAPFCDDEKLMQISKDESCRWSGQEVFYRIKLGGISEFEFLETLFREIQNKIKKLSTGGNLELISLYEKLMITECIAYLELMRAEFKFPHEVGAKTIVLFKALIKNWRIDQIYTIIWGQCRNALAYKEQYKLTRKHASNLIIGRIGKYVDKATQNNWEINGYYRDSRNHKNKQSTISYVLFNKVLDLGGSGIEYNFQDVMTKLGILSLSKDPSASDSSDMLGIE